MSEPDASRWYQIKPLLNGYTSRANSCFEVRTASGCCKSGYKVASLFARHVTDASINLDVPEGINITICISKNVNQLYSDGLCPVPPLALLRGLCLCCYEYRAHDVRLQCTTWHQVTLYLWLWLVWDHSWCPPKIWLCRYRRDSAYSMHTVNVAPAGHSIC